MIGEIDFIFAFGSIYKHFQGSIDNFQNFILPESIESSRFVSHRARMSAEFDSKKDSQSTKFERRPQIFVKLSFIELCDSKLSDLTPIKPMLLCLQTHGRVV